VDTNENFLPAFAITPIDGRNRHKVEPLAQYFSEFALDKYRIFVEIRYLEWLSVEGIIRKLRESEKSVLEKVWGDFSIEDFKRIHEIEKTTNHDLKAVEYWIREKVQKTSLMDLTEMIHFGLGSDDVNNLAFTLSLKDSLEKIIFPEIKKTIIILLEFAKKTKSFPILARTHGQIASVTTIGKEIFVFAHRLTTEFLNLRSVQLTGKINGDVGNWHSHYLIFPKTDWIKKSDEFVKSLGLTPQLVTTQIETYDSWIRLFNSLRLINSILIGLCQDMWTYSSLGIFKLKVIENEVGSSLMPHKVNPIYFEGAEGGLELGNSLLYFFTDKFSINRLQRDFSDSTVRRNVGFVLSHCLLAYQSIQEGVNRVVVEREKMEEELIGHYEVLAEGIQSYLRKKRFDRPYELLKKFTRGRSVDKKNMTEFIGNLPISLKDRNYLLGLTPASYTGLAEKVVDTYLRKDLAALQK